MPQSGKEAVLLVINLATSTVHKISRDNNASSLRPHLGSYCFQQKNLPILARLHLLTHTAKKTSAILPIKQTTHSSGCRNIRLCHRAGDQGIGDGSSCHSSGTQPIRPRRWMPCSCSCSTVAAASGPSACPCLPLLRLHCMQHNLV